jgi:uncharacterized protein YbjT (DUF2867 family)
MAQLDAQIIAVVGATGLQGGAVTRRLLQDHWPVRALTRNPDGKKARAIAQLGVEVVKADLSEPASLERAFDGVYGVFSVQNHHISGYGGGGAAGKAGRRGGQAGGRCPARLQRRWPRRQG